MTPQAKAKALYSIIVRLSNCFSVIPGVFLLALLAL